MISKKFKKLFNASTDIDTLVEKRQSLVQQIVDLESELASDSQHYSYSELQDKMNGYASIKQKHAYLDALIDVKRPPAKDFDMPDFQT